MPLQVRRGTEANRDFVAAEGEPLWTTDTSTLYIGDGTTIGGVLPKTAPSGSAGGDLNGTYPNPVVHKIHGNNVESGTPSDGEVLQYVAASTRWSHKYPALTTAQSFIGADVSMATANTDYDVTSLSLAAGTWFIHAAATMYNNLAGAAILTIEIYDATGAATLASASQQIPTQIPNACNTSCACVVTLAATSTVKLRARANANTKTIVYQAFPSTKGNASGIMATRIA